MFSCETWNETEDVSHVSYLPEFTLEGGDFISLVKVDSGEFDDPGASPLLMECWSMSGMQTALLMLRLRCIYCCILC